MGLGDDLMITGIVEQEHAKYPDKYKDPNHQPEIAIALSDDLKACYGFCTAEKI
mgnify:CR=1 FL=1